MSARTIVTWPDDRLRRPSLEIEKIDASVHDLYLDLVDSLRASRGLGLAAPQIGDPRQMFVVAARLLGRRPSALPVAFLNPEVLWTSEESEDDEEGCLSFPGIFIRVKRPSRVRMRAQGLDGVARETAATGLLARCLLHEQDHLMGRLFDDYRAKAALP